MNALAWPADRLGEALRILARKSGLGPGELDPGEPSDTGDPGAWIVTAAATMGLEAETVEVPYRDVESLVRQAAPALLRLPGEGESCFLALLRGGRRTAMVLDPERRVRRVPVAEICRALRREHDDRLGPEVDRLLDESQVPARRRERARTALLAERLGRTRIGGAWILDLPPGGSFGGALRHARLPGRATVLVGAHMMQHALLLASWWVLGRSVLQGRLDAGWLLAWALLQFTVIPFRGLELWSAGLLMARAGRLLKRRLMMGALRVEPEETRHQGAGQLLSRILGSESLEFLALTGGHIGLITLSEIVLALPVLAAGAAGWPHALLLLAWVAFAVWLGWSYFRQRRAWTVARLDMTHDLVEQMVGHRTRLAQQSPDRWHEREDRQLERYLDLSSGLDSRAAWLRVLIPRGWLLLSLIAIARPFITGEASAARLAVAIGGALFAYWSLWKMVRGLADLAEAAVSWSQVAPIFHAAARTEPIALEPLPEAGSASVVVEGHDLVFRYGERADPAVAGASLRIRSGERLLLEGPSGGGKSTLGSLLSGLRVPQSGLLLLQGLDRQSLGLEGWRRRVVAAPQFQENHVLTDTLLFNLLMGREWPPGPADAAEAEEVCRELGLGDLLDRMPAGVLQMVGDTGWQLSHGEKSRLYIARALLQDAELVVLDESFAALDPESLRQALACVLRRARTLLVIAHP